MRKYIFLTGAFIIISSILSPVAWGLSQTPPSVSPCETAAVVERIEVTGGKRFSEDEIQKVLTHRLGDVLTTRSVQRDLRAIAALYRSDASFDTEVWSGFELITSKVTVTPDFVRSSPGRVNLTYKIKEWF